MLSKKNKIREFRDARGLSGPMLSRLLPPQANGEPHGQTWIDKAEKSIRGLTIDGALELAGAFNCRAVEFMSPFDLDRIARLFVKGGTDAKTKAYHTIMNLIRDVDYIEYLSQNIEQPKITRAVEDAQYEVVSQDATAVAMESDPHDKPRIDMICAYHIVRSGRSFIIDPGSPDDVEKHPAIKSAAGYGIYVYDDVMSPRYRPGQLLYADPARSPAVGNGVIITLMDKRILVREWVGWDGDGNAIVVKYQPEPSRVTIPGDNILELNTVVGTREVS